MINRREALQIAAATAALGIGNFSRAMAQQRLTQNELLRFDDFGNITLLHMADLHGQLSPVYAREPSRNVGIGDLKREPPYLTGAAFLKRFNIKPKSANAYAMSSEDFAALAKTYGRIGGLDRMATVVKTIRASRGTDRVLFLDGGDTWQGSLVAHRTNGQAIVDCMKLLKPDAMTGHWEFTYGEKRVKELIDDLGYPFLALNVRDTNGRSRCSSRTRSSTRAASRSRCWAKPSPIHRSPIRAG